MAQLRAGGSTDKVGILQKMDSDLHRRLERHFPDWKERMDYQKRQEEIILLRVISAFHLRSLPEQVRSFSIKIAELCNAQDEK